MGYYRGDGGNYYRGDYYRGDPFLGSLLVGGAKFVGKKLLRGAARTVRGLTRAASSPVINAAATGGALGFGIGQGTIPSIPGREGSNYPVPTGMDPDAYRRQLYAQGFLKRRKMNPLNPRALGRALRRAQGFEKFAARTVNTLYRVIDGRRVRTFKKK